MACPHHVSGAAAFIKSVHPHWPSSLIESALITTASISKNLGKTVTNTSYFPSNEHESGAGEISPMKALDPGLAFKTTIKDHQNDIRLISQTNFSCPKTSTNDLITNVGPPNATYVSSVNAPPGLVVRVVPKKIVLREGVKKASFRVVFDGQGASKGPGISMGM